MNAQGADDRPDGAATVLEARGVSKSFVAAGRRVEALRDVSLRALAGNVTGLIGPDGAGKTTLMRIAAGLLKADAGAVRVEGIDVADRPLEVQSLIGYMPQRFGLYEDLSVRENLDLYADLQGVPAALRAARHEELLRMTALGAFQDRLAGRLSGGMKQKLGLACALLRSPPLLLLDEPTVGVDPLSRRELWAILRRLVEREAVSVLLSTAYLDEAQRCDEVAVLHGGRLLEQGPPDRFRGRAEGGTFLLRCPAGAKRALRRRAAESPAVLDALVQADGVRVVLRTSDAAELRSSLAGGGDVTVEPVEPRFEDGFVMMLGERGPLEAQAAPQPPPAEAAPPPAAARDGETVIEAASLVRKFGDFYAVREVSFQVRRGEVFALLGPNGAGKSTTFRMLCGLLPATAGTLRVAGVNLRRAPAAARARIGYVSQKFSLYAGLSVRENLRFFSSAYGLWGRSRRRQIERMLGEFHLAAFAEAASGSLPPGYQQRLAMACALMHEPEILFLDEPTSGVDVLARREFWGRINALAERGVTVMVTTHYMEEAEYCDRLAIMSGGRVLAIGPPAEIRDAARGGDLPAPSMEDAFVRLIAGQQRREGER